MAVLHQKTPNEVPRMVAWVGARSLCLYNNNDISGKAIQGLMQPDSILKDLDLPDGNPQVL